MDINLRFINRTNDASSSEFVVFQKNVTSSFDEQASAWKVIKNCGQGDDHPFTFSTEMGVSLSDRGTNFMPQGAIDDSRLLAKTSGVMPQQQAVIESNPTIWIGAVSEAEEGEVLNSAILAGGSTEISLQGIKSADIVATGGGSSETPISFVLENVVMS